MQKPAWQRATRGAQRKPLTPITEPELNKAIAAPLPVPLTFATIDVAHFLVNMLPPLAQKLMIFINSL